MNHITSNLLIFGNLDKSEPLLKLSEIFADFENKSIGNDELVSRIYEEIRNILRIATDFGFDKNLWQNYLTFLLVTNENPFTVTCEKTGAQEGSVNYFAKSDCKLFIELFKYDFSKIENELKIDCFTRITNYKAIVKKELMYNKNVSEKVRNLSERLSASKDENEFFTHLTNFYRDFGVGMFGLNKAFRLKNIDSGIELIPINNMDRVVLDDLVGYELQKRQLVQNTLAFVENKKANNVLLYGDSGTGKSTSIKAIVNEFYSKGLRMIEIYKHQFKDLSNVIAMIKNRNYKFIIYMDDLSFEEFEIEYKFLKAVIEGGVETKPDNILIYATSNRRHLIKETWNDRSDMESDNGIHRSDTIEEKLSLVNRFGVKINYSKPTRQEYHSIVTELAKRNGIELSEEELIKEANKWEISHGGISGRTAQQFINNLLGQTKYCLLYTSDAPTT